MFLFDEPSTQRIARFLDAQREDAKAPTGYAVDYNRVKLGDGPSHESQKS